MLADDVKKFGAESLSLKRRQDQHLADARTHVLRVSVILERKEIH